MNNYKQKIADILLVGMVGYSVFGSLVFFALKYFASIREYSIYAFLVVTLFFVKEAVIIWKDNDNKIAEPN